MRNNSDLFYVCSLIEFIGRKQKRKRSEVVADLGRDTLVRLYGHADVFHCEPIEKTADEFIARCGIQQGNYDNVAACRYLVPDYWTIGAVYERLIEDICQDNEEKVTEVLRKVYFSWIDAAISNYNTDFYYQSRDYIYECYMAGKVL